jgi:preprotein translocase subunit SecE
MAKTTSKTSDASGSGKRAMTRTAPAKPVASAGGVSDRRVVRFFREVRIEMGKVTWPDRQELVQSTIVVLVAVAIAAAYIGVFDLIWSSLVNLVRLGS